MSADNQQTVSQLSANMLATSYLSNTQDASVVCQSTQANESVGLDSLPLSLMVNMCITSMSHHSLMDFFMMLMISITIIFIAATRKKVHQSQKKKINRNKSTYY